MQKDFDKWNESKKITDATDCSVNFYEREIWWCSIGLNVGREQSSFSDDFSRPLIIFRKCTPDIFLGIPLTTKVTNQAFRFRFAFNNIENDVLLFHTREFDRKRLMRKIGMMSESDFSALRQYFKDSM